MFCFDIGQLIVLAMNLQQKQDQFYLTHQHLYILVIQLHKQYIFITCLLSPTECINGTKRQHRNKSGSVQKN